MNIDKICSEWKDLDTVSVFGLGHILKNSLERLLLYHNIDTIYDNNANLKEAKYRDIPIKTFSENDVRNDKKILISTHYEDIKKQLLRAGLQEYKDFWVLDKYLTLMEWHVNKRVYANEIHISITTKCSLRCQKCNMFMPKYKNSTHISIDNILSDVEALFSKVDYVETLALLGGEPLLYPSLCDLISCIYEKYNDKYGIMEIITNGTIIPNDELLTSLTNKKIFFRISDYSMTLHYEKKLDSLTAKLTQFGIPYYVNKSLNWLDFGFPENPISIPDDKVYQHMMECSPAFKGLNDNKIYFCHVVWSADKCGIYKEKDTDYFSLTTGQRQELVKYLLGIMKEPVSLCKYCAGCSDNNKNVIPIADQVI